MTTPRTAVEAEIEAKRKTCEAVMLRELQYIGEACVNTARDRYKAGKQYMDRTGNLTSSMGYIIVKAGNILRQGEFSQISGEASKGPSAGLSYAKSLVGQVRNQNYTLIVVAGMNYALAVQSKGYDVLDSAELLAKDLISSRQHQVNEILKTLGL